MILSDNEREKIIKLVEQALVKLDKKVELIEEPTSEDNEEFTKLTELKSDLTGIIDKMSIEDDFSLPLRIPEEDMIYASEVIQAMERVVEMYVKKLDVNDIVGLEEAKKELTVQLMYLSSYKDKFLYEIEYMEETLKKEIFSKITSEIAMTEGISYTQAEKKVNADVRYSDLRRQVTEAKIYMTTIKTKYDYFSKMIQVIVQSISVAGKEQYSARVTN